MSGEPIVALAGAFFVVLLVVEAGGRDAFEDRVEVSGPFDLDQARGLAVIEALAVVEVPALDQPHFANVTRLSGYVTV